jgi:predicted Rossmann fold flavoprotein
MITREEKYDTIVVGGGPSGIFAAGFAAEHGARVVLLEKTAELGKKLLITGKGRCNLTNSSAIEDFIGNYGRNGKFLYRAFREYFSNDLIDFFSAAGVVTKVERGGRVFPESDEARTIVGALKHFLHDKSVTVRLQSPVRRLLTSNGRIAGVEIESGEAYHAQTIILATGGLSYPGTGSTGDGYKMATGLGHTVVRATPALVPLETAEGFVKDLQGLGLKNVRVKVLSGGKTVASEFGEMLFTHFGVSGPVILTLSGDIAERLQRQEEICISINYKPALDSETLTRRLLREFEGAGLKSIANILKSLLPSSLIPVFLSLSGIAQDKKGNQMSRTDREKLYSLLTDFRLRVVRTRPIAEAIVTRGGVSLKEIDPHTMESKKVPGLYFCGELIDIDGTTGGYNLQAAFSTGYLAGVSARGGGNG